MTGTVKFFNRDKRFGFIVRDDGGKDVFVHESQVVGPSITENDKVKFEIEDSEKGPTAVNVEKE